MRALALLILAAAVAGPAWAQPTPRSQVTPDGAVQVVMGERVTVRLSEAGAPELVAVEAAPPGSAAPPAPGKGAFEDAPSGMIVITLERFKDTGVLMKVLSGVPKAFDYRAVMVHERQPGRFTGEPTSVCTVLPLLQNFEHWPRRAEASGILLTDFRFRDTNEVVCPKREETK